MNNSVIIKSNPYGITLILDDQISFDDILNNVIEKFKSSGSFFKDAALAISFEERELSDDQQIELVNAITANTSINIVCIADNDENKTQLFKEKIKQPSTNVPDNDALFYKGTLRSGQVLESEKSIIIIGDVNPGAKVISKGNIIVIGALKGTVYAGASENQDAFVIALIMNPVQIKIGEVIARCADEKTAFFPKIRKQTETPDTMVAYVKDGMIFIESLNHNTK